MPRVSVVVVVMSSVACSPGAPPLTAARLPAVDASPSPVPLDRGPPLASSVDGDATPPTEIGGPGAPKLCGCALCTPLASDDPCTADADCAPATPCHATRCVVRAKAVHVDQPVCTRSLRCDSADTNACGCVAGRCALHPR